MDAERARFVRGGGDDAAVARPATPDDHRLAAVLGMVALLDGRVERVEVAVEDRSSLCDRRVHPIILAPCVFASAPMNRASASPSSSDAARSARVSAPNGRMFRIASVFVVTSAQVPAATPSTRKTASISAFFVYTAARCLAAITRSRCLYPIRSSS